MPQRVGSAWGKAEIWLYAGAAGRRKRRQVAGDRGGPEFTAARNIRGKKLPETDDCNGLLTSSWALRHLDLQLVCPSRLVKGEGIAALCNPDVQEHLNKSLAKRKRKKAKPAKAAYMSCFMLWQREKAPLPPSSASICGDHRGAGMLGSISPRLHIVSRFCSNLGALWGKKSRSVLSQAAPACCLLRS